MPREHRPETANQTVAYNLARARALRGWTQEEAADKLAFHLGERWSKASWSAAERSVDGVRPRNFTADEILAFAETFNLPVAWFFLPPHDSGGGEQPGKLDVALVGAQMGYDGGQEAYEDRVTGLLKWLGIPKAAPQMIFDRILDNAVNSRARRELSRFRANVRSLLDAIERAESDERPITFREEDK